MPGFPAAWSCAGRTRSPQSIIHPAQKYQNLRSGFSGFAGRLSARRYNQRFNGWIRWRLISAFSAAAEQAEFNIQCQLQGCQLGKLLAFGLWHTLAVWSHTQQRLDAVVVVQSKAIVHLGNALQREQRFQLISPDRSATGVPRRRSAHAARSGVARRSRPATGSRSVSAVWRTLQASGG